MIQCENTGLVFANPQPHLKAVHAWHPSIAVLGDGELLCAFDLGEAAESLDYRTYLSRSTDGGLTWGPPQRLFEDTPARNATHTMRIAALRDGSLVGFGARFYRDDPSEGLTNRTTIGFVPMDLILLRGDKTGRNWTGPTTVAPPLDGPAFELCHNIVELADGRWLAPTQTWPAWDGRAPHGWKAIALVSPDRGATWTDYLDIFVPNGQPTIHFEQSVVQLPDGRLLAVSWAYDSKTQQTLPTPYTISDDLKTFSPAMPTGLQGQTAKILALHDGRVLCVYRRGDKPGLWAQLVQIDGNRWINLGELELWSGSISERSTGNTSDELCSLKFGFPSLLELPNGIVKIVFWCVENGAHVIRWFDLRIAAMEVPSPHFGERRAADPTVSVR
jgi:hypothetical protein